MDLGPLVPIAAMGVGLGWGIIGLKRKQLDIIARRATDEAASERAQKHMLEVHEQGRSVLWTGDREKAELYLQQLHGYLLLATIEQAGE